MSWRTVHGNWVATSIELVRLIDARPKEWLKVGDLAAQMNMPVPDLAELCRDLAGVKLLHMRTDIETHEATEVASRKTALSELVP